MAECGWMDGWRQQKSAINWNHIGIGQGSSNWRNLHGKIIIQRILWMTEQKQRNGNSQISSTIRHIWSGTYLLIPTNAHSARCKIIHQNGIRIVNGWHTRILHWFSIKSIVRSFLTNECALVVLHFIIIRAAMHAVNHHLYSVALDYLGILLVEMKSCKSISESALFEIARFA